MSNHLADANLIFTTQSFSTSVTAQIQGTELQLTTSENYFGTSVVRVTATDGLNAAIEEFTLTVNPVNDEPAFTLSQSEVNATINFSNPISILVAGNSPENESSQVISYSLSPVSTSFANISIDSFTGEITISSISNLTGSQIFSVMANDGQLQFNQFSQTFTLSVNNQNPSDISISFAQVEENNSDVVFVGQFSIQDNNVGIPVFSLVSGTGDNDNSSFSILNGQLITNAVFNFEEKTSYSIRVRAEDGLGGAVEKVFMITVIDMDDLPEAILLSNNKITEDHATGTVVGNFSVTDEDQGLFSTNYEFSPVSGDGINDADNSNFAISGSSLLLIGSLDATLQPKHFINVMASTESKIIFALTEDNLNAKKADDFDAATITSAFVIEVSEANPTGLQLSQLYSVRAYPNPSKGIFTVEFLEKMDKEFTISIFDLNGNQVETVIVNQGSKSIMLDLGNQKSGLYLMKIVSDGHSSTLPLIRE